MTLLITITLMALSAFCGAMTALRWKEGRRELEVDRLEAERFERGRRGTVRLKPLRIRR